MSIKKPYFRIAREKIDKYIQDERYAADRTSLCRVYNMLENDLKNIFEFIEPCENNLKVYSHRLYELYLRACTEFETNCKRILEVNDCTLPDRPTVEHYYKINQSSKLSEYEVALDFWQPKRKILSPFKNWRTTHTLEWYQKYNTVKHDRYKNFECASLKNVINAVSAVFIILYSQFDFITLLLYNSSEDVLYHETNKGEKILHAKSLFMIANRPRWNESEKYEFDWEHLENRKCPFQKFNYK